jgi:two-component sensor histidine kinase
LEEVLGRSVLEWTAEEDRDKNALEISQCLRQGFVRNLEINYTAETGLSTPIEINATVVDDKDNPIILSLCRDISERKQAEEEIKAALQEKEVLLLEIHHRVKNNLQVISSLLSLQSSRMEDKKAATILRETKDKIYAMALLYERLCQSKNLAIISFPSYVAALVTSLFQSIEADSARIAPRFNVANLPIDIDTAIPCGLIINELVTNAIKYAFPDGREGEIHITLSPAPDDQVILVVSDNGVGISPDLDLSQVKSLGLQLVRGLAAQLQGSLDIEHNGGTTFRITFPLPGIKN